jgi:hypothetical protein
MDSLPIKVSERNTVAISVRGGALPTVEIRPTLFIAPFRQLFA